MPLTSSRIGSGAAGFGAGAAAATGVAAFEVFDMVDAFGAADAGCAEFVADVVGVSVCGYSSIEFAAESAFEFLAGDGAEAYSTFSGFEFAGVGAATGVLAAADSDFFAASAAGFLAVAFVASGFFAASESGFFALSGSGCFAGPVTVMETT